MQWKRDIPALIAVEKMAKNCNSVCAGEERQLNESEILLYNKALREAQEALSIADELTNLAKKRFVNK